MENKSATESKLKKWAHSLELDVPTGISVATAIVSVVAAVVTLGTSEFMLKTELLLGIGISAAAAAIAAAVYIISHRNKS